MGRRAVTAGKHLDDFISLIGEAILEVGVERDEIFVRSGGGLNLPGFFRATKEWDLLVVRKNRLLAVIEMKSQVGSFGNNLNNRVEESVGSAFDLQRAQHYGAFGDTLAPWIGYFFLLEERAGSKGSLHPIKITSPHFGALSEFLGSSYLDRVQELCRRLVSEKLYNSAWFLVTKSDATFRHPDPQLAALPFIESLQGHLRAQLAAEVDQ